MSSLRIFVSFEFDKDNDLKNQFFTQAKDLSPHRVVSSSLNEAYPTEEWIDKARSAIRGCDVVIVLMGQDTHNAPGVETEIDIARQLRKPIFQIVPQRRTYTGVHGLDQPIQWKWKRINKKLDEVRTQS